MPNFTFKKDDVKVYVVDTDSKTYNIDTNDIEFGQTFQEKSFAVKTIHDQGSFEGSVINRANPAEFSLNTPLLEEATNKILFTKLLNSATFDLYISSQYDVWKLEKCVIQDGTFEINKSRPLRLAISGEASKLSKYTPVDSVALNAISGKRIIIDVVGNTNWISVGAPSSIKGTIFTATGNTSGNGGAKLAVPGTLQNTTITTTTYIMPTLSTLTFGTTDVSSGVTGLSVELQNDAQWNAYTTVHGALLATNAETSQYPTNIRNGKKVLGGSIQRYLADTSTTVNTWNSDTSLRLRAGRDVGKTVISLTVVSQGSGYNSVPEVTISGGGGTGATATATLTGTAVTGLTLTNPGSGYSSTPTVTIAESPNPYANATATATTDAESVVYGVDFNISNCSFTNRMAAGNIFREEYNWRMTQNPTALSDVIIYTTT